MDVPPAYEEAFRLATIAEVRSCGKWVASNAEDLSRECATSHEPGKVNAGDLLGSMRLLREDVRILDQLLLGQSLNEVYEAGSFGDEIKGDACALAHIAETMAQKVIPPMIASATECSPFDTETVEKVEPLTEALGWAAGEAARLHAVADVEREAAKAADQG